MITIDTAFMKEYNGYIERCLKKHGVPNRDMIDLVQDVYEKVMVYQDYYEEKWNDNMRSYIYYVVIHCVNRKYRGNDVMDKYVSLDTNVVVDGERMPVYETLTSEDSLTKEENDNYYLNNTDEVLESLEQLKYPQREVVRLKLIMGKSHKEIAGALDISETNSQQLLKRGIEQLRKIVTGEDYVEVLQQKYRGVHNQPITTNDDSGTGVWNDSFWRPQKPSPVKHYTQEDIDNLLKGE